MPNSKTLLSPLFLVYPIPFACHFTDDFFCPKKRPKKTNLWPFSATFFPSASNGFSPFPQQREASEKVAEENERVFNSKFPSSHPPTIAFACLQFFQGVNGEHNDSLWNSLASFVHAVKANTSPPIECNGKLSKPVGFYQTIWSSPPRIMLIKSCKRVHLSNSSWIISLPLVRLPPFSPNHVIEDLQSRSFLLLFNIFPSMTCSADFYSHNRELAITLRR